MNIEQIAIELIDPDPGQARQIFKDIDQLADDIFEQGLLSPLVVQQVGDRFHLKAGERRYRAIKKLIGDKKYEPLVFCIVHGSKEDLTFAAISSNVHQQELAIWEYGHRFVALMDAGMTQEEIATRIHKSQTWVSRAVRIARGLAPAVVKKLIALGQKALTPGELLKLSYLYDTELDEPDECAQLKLLERLINNPRTRGRPRSGPRQRTEKEIVVERYHNMKKGAIKVPPHAEPYVKVMMGWLSGLHSLDFTNIIPASIKPAAKKKAKKK